VAGAFEELPIVPGRGLQPVQHLVERGAEAVQLVVGGWEVQPVVESGDGDRRGLAAHPLDRPEPESGHPPPGQGGKQDGYRTADREDQHEAGEFVGTVSHACADDEDLPA